MIGGFRKTMSLFDGGTATYSGYALSLSPSSYYKLNDPFIGDPVPVVDSIGNHNGVFRGTDMTTQTASLTLETGNTSCTFDGINTGDRVDIETDVLNGIRSICLLFKLTNDFDSTDTVTRSLIVRDNSGGTTNEVQLYLDPSNGKLTFTIYSGGSAYTVVSDRTYWHSGFVYHIVAQIDNNNGMEMYVNGDKQTDTESLLTSAISSSTDDTAIASWGDDTSTNTTFDGAIDEVFFGTNVLSTTNINKMLYYAGLGGAISDLGPLIYYRFNDYWYNGFAQNEGSDTTDDYQAHYASLMLLESETILGGTSQSTIKQGSSALGFVNVYGLNSSGVQAYYTTNTPASFICHVKTGSVFSNYDYIWGGGSGTNMNMYCDSTGLLYVRSASTGVTLSLNTEYCIIVNATTTSGADVYVNTGNNTPITYVSQSTLTLGAVGCRETGTGWDYRWMEDGVISEIAVFDYLLDSTDRNIITDYYLNTDITTNREVTRSLWYYPVTSHSPLLYGSPTNCCFGDSGKYLFYTNATGDNIDRYTLSEPYSIDRYVNKISIDETRQLFNIGAHDSVARGIAFKPDGLKMYVIGDTNNAIFEFDLNTAWDLEDTVTLNDSYTLGTTAPDGLYINSTGTKMWYTDTGTDFIYQYNFSTAWDVTTLSKDSTEELDLNPPFTAPRNFTFKPDGTKLYISDAGTDVIAEYSMGSGDEWKVSQATSTGESFDMTSYENDPRSILFNSDGTNLMIVGYQRKWVYNFPLSTAYDLSTAPTYVPQFLDQGVTNAAQRCIVMSPDGTRIYMTEGGTADKIHYWLLSTAWDLTTATFQSETDVTSITTVPYGLRFKPDGTKVYMTDHVGNVYQCSLNPAWDTSTISYDSKTYAHSGGIADGNCFDFNSTGTKAYFSTGSEILTEHTLSTAWDISTVNATASNTINLNGLSKTILDMRFDGSGQYLYFIGTATNQRIMVMYLSTAWDLSTATMYNRAYPSYDLWRGRSYFHVSPDRSKLFIVNTDLSVTYRYDVAN